MSQEVLDHLEAVRLWLLDVEQRFTPPALGLSRSEKQQLQTVNKAVAQLAKLGVEIPHDLRTLKLRLSARDSAPECDCPTPEDEAAVEEVSSRLNEMDRTARLLRAKMRPKDGGLRPRTQYRVSLSDLIDAGLLSVDDRLELEWSKAVGAFEGRLSSDGTVEVYEAGQWHRYDSLSNAAEKMSGRSQNGWRQWKRINADGSKTVLLAIRDQYLAQEPEE